MVNDLSMEIFGCSVNEVNEHTDGSGVRNEFENFESLKNEFSNYTDNPTDGYLSFLPEPILDILGTEIAYDIIVNKDSVISDPSLKENTYVDSSDPSTVLIDNDSLKIKIDINSDNSITVERLYKSDEYTLGGNKVEILITDYKIENMSSSGEEKLSIENEMLIVGFESNDPENDPIDGIVLRVDVAQDGNSDDVRSVDLDRRVLLLPNGNAFMVKDVEQGGPDYVERLIDENSHDNIDDALTDIESGFNLDAEIGEDINSAIEDIRDAFRDNGNVNDVDSEYNRIDHDNDGPEHTLRSLYEIDIAKEYAYNDNDDKDDEIESGTESDYNDYDNDDYDRDSGFTD